MDEVRNIEARYALRGDDLERSSIVPCHRLLSHQEKERVFLKFLRRYSLAQIPMLSVLEIGSGFGQNLMQFIRWGFDPSNLTGSELLPDRTEIAKRTLPSSVVLVTGDSSKLSIADGACDIVLISTVFSSILDDSFQKDLAQVAWRFVRPGGGILWYDFIYNNPKNPDVRGVPLSRIRELFPEANFTFNRVTLAPPIARRVGKTLPGLYSVLNSFPFLRTHVAGWIGKPR